MGNPVLVFDRVRLLLDDRANETLSVDIALGPGDLVMVNTEEEQQDAGVAAASCGLLTPTSGLVRFLGHDWVGLPQDYADALRGRIGQATAAEGWVPHLTVTENICLSRLHHTRRPLAELRAEAAALSVHFGLPGLPSGLPSDLGAHDRVRAAFVRAFLGSPDLIVLGSRHQASLAGLTGPIVNAVCAARERGAAVLWLTSRSETWNDETIPATHRLSVRDDTIASEAS